MTPSGIEPATFRFVAQYLNHCATAVPLHVKYPLFLSDFNEINFLDRFSKNSQISDFMKIRPVGAQLFHADRLTDRHEEANIRFRNFAKYA
jgi:hypothetical protein